jgi:hypothetical protein
MIAETKRKPVGRLEFAIWAMCTCAALGIIFVVPKALPVVPTVSDSYLFGYNNRAGVALLLLFLGIGGYFSDRLGLHFPQPASAGVVPRWAVWSWMAIFVASTGAMYWLLRGFHGIGESMYFIDRLSSFATGARPYRDFEFGYGISFLYGPLAFLRLGLNVEQSYYSFLTLDYLASVWILAEVLDLIDVDTKVKPLLFHLFCLFALVDLIGLGMQYTLLRFLLAPYFAILVQRVDIRGGERNRAVALCMTAAFTAVLLVISSEQAVMFAVGTIGYLVVLKCIRGSLGGWRQVLSFAGLLLAELVLMIGANRFGLFMTMKTFGTGAYNFPLIPAGHILLFFFCCWLAAMYVANRLRERAKGEALLIVVAVSVCGLFAALGRCDPGHVVFDGIGIVIAASMLASTMPFIWRSYVVLFLVFFLVLPTASIFRIYRPLLGQAVHMRIALSESADSSKLFDSVVRLIRSNRPGNLRPDQYAVQLSAVETPVLDLRAAFPTADGVLEAPFAFSPNGLGTYHAPEIDTGYFEGLELAFTSESIQRKILELKAHPERKLLLPENFEDRCALHLDGEYWAIRTLFWYPYASWPKNLVNIRAPLCIYIYGHYRLIQKPGPRGYGYGVWTPAK